jgi:hypothetical protein
MHLSDRKCTICAADITVILHSWRGILKSVTERSSRIALAILIIIAVGIRRVNNGDYDYE